MAALYRKYRPNVFGDVIAQDHVTRTLINQIATGRVTHAYLFTGSRGTGKTTCARIFARAVNCLSPENGSPCGKCEVCKALDGPGNMDIVELDAASNNGVDQIREIVEGVQYPPVHGKYKVYIIDEVHMLSPSAFNALLKTLEEPPAHVIFILATTEVHKLPATVLSRCMRFDFRLVPQQVLMNRLKEVYALEGVTADDEAVRLISAAAEGSWRDLLSLADRCMNYSSTLTADDVGKVLGTSGREGTRELVTAIASGDAGRVLTVVERICAEGKSAGLVAKDVASFARDLLLLKASDRADIAVTSEELGTMKDEAATYTTDFLVTLMTVFSAVDAELRYSVSPRIALECAAVKAAKLLSADIAAIEERLARLERALSGGGGAVNVVRANTQTPGGTAAQNTAGAGNSAANAANSAASAAGAGEGQARVRPDKPMDPRSVWGRVLTHFRTKESSQLFALLDRASDVSISGNKLVITAQADSYLRLVAPDMTEALTRALDADGMGLVAEVKKAAGGVDMDGEIARLKKLIGDAKLNVKN